MNEETQTEQVPYGFYLAKVDAVTEDSIRQARLFDLQFTVLKGRFRDRKLSGRFLFSKGWRPTGTIRTGDGLADFMRAENKARELTAVDLIGAIGMVQVSHRIEGRGGNVVDFRNLRLSPEVDLRHWRSESGIEIDNDVVDAVRPDRAHCPRCLDAVGEGTPKCPKCKVDLAAYWEEHCPRCIREIDSDHLFCPVCGTAAVGGGGRADLQRTMMWPGGGE